MTLFTVAQDVQRKTFQSHSSTFSWKELSILAASLRKVCRLQGETGIVSEVGHQALMLLGLIFSYCTLS